MKLFLSQVDSHSWRGLVDINGETFKVTLFPGSATKDWEAVLEIGGWVELSDDSKLTQAIEKSYTLWNLIEPAAPHNKPQAQEILEALKTHPELLEDITKILKEAGKNE